MKQCRVVGDDLVHSVGGSEYSRRFSCGRKPNIIQIGTFCLEYHSLRLVNSASLYTENLERGHILPEEKQGVIYFQLQV